MATATADLNLYAHLMRRAGFGARLDELEVLASRPYEDVVEDLLHPERFPDVEIDMIERFYSTGNAGYGPIWWSRMFNSRRQLEEKMTLFWHHIFATGQSKSAHNPSAQAQINMFRRLGMTDIRTLLLELSKDPAMIFWLDNNENLKDEPNENYGRELLELFSMGVGNYTEEDVKAAAYAFTGWTLETPIPGAGSRYGGYHSKFVFLKDEHDHSDKDFLGELGDWDGDDIVDIIVKQPAAARFISRHMYNYFVADEPPVSNWNETPPKDPAAINVLSEAYLSSDGDIRSMLRALFNSDFFKDARYMRVKTPTELVTAVVKLTGEYQEIEIGMSRVTGATGSMGQSLMNPLTVEGWPFGAGWIDGGTLNERVNFAVDELSDAEKPGIRLIIDRLKEIGHLLSPAEFVGECVQMVRPAPLSKESILGLLNFAEQGQDLDLIDESKREISEFRVLRMIQLIVATREYQLN